MYLKHWRRDEITVCLSGHEFKTVSVPLRVCSSTFFRKDAYCRPPQGQSHLLDSRNLPANSRNNELGTVLYSLKLLWVILFIIRQAITISPYFLAKHHRTNIILNNSKVTRYLQESLYTILSPPERISHEKQQDPYLWPPQGT